MVGPLVGPLVGAAGRVGAARVGAARVGAGRIGGRRCGGGAAGGASRGRRGGGRGVARGGPRRRTTRRRLLAGGRSAGRDGSVLGVRHRRVPVVEGDHQTGDDGGGGSARDGSGRGMGDDQVAGPAEQDQHRPGRGAAGSGGEVGGRDGAEQQGREQRTEVGVDLHQLEVDPGARAALLEVLLDARGLATGEAAADVAAELAAGALAGVVLDRRGMHREVGLAQTLAGSVGESRDGVGRHAEQEGDLGGLLPLDLGVPQDQLPALGQRGEGARGGGALEPLDGGVAEGHTRVERGQVVGGVQA